MSVFLHYLEGLRFHLATLYGIVPSIILAFYGLMELGNFVQMRATQSWLSLRPEDSVTVPGKIVPTRGQRGGPSPRVRYTTSDGRVMFRAVDYGVPYFKGSLFEIGQEVEVTYCVSDRNLFYIEPYLAQTLAACARKRIVSPAVMTAIIVVIAFLLFLA